MRIFRLAAILFLALYAGGCGAVRAGEGSPVTGGLEATLRSIIAAAAPDSAEIAVAMFDLARGDSLLIDAHTPMHAASTMKVPVMIELFRKADAGTLSLDAPVPVGNRFTSIADGSEYTLSAGDDSDSTLYSLAGQSLPLRELVTRMIARSSNLATNLLIDLANPADIAATLEQLGASEMRALRGVEDIPAFRRGMNNTTTAYGLMKTLQAIADGSAASPAANAEMIRILEEQQFREMIPAGLPEGTRVANKTGWITGISHDGAIVMPQGRALYVLVVLTRGLPDPEDAARIASRISGVVWESVAGRQ